MDKKSLSKKIKFQHDFDRLASKKLAYVYQLLIPDNLPKQKEPVSNKSLVSKQK